MGERGNWERKRAGELKGSQKNDERDGAGRGEVGNENETDGGQSCRGKYREGGREAVKRRGRT